MKRIEQLEAENRRLKAIHETRVSLDSEKVKTLEAENAKLKAYLMRAAGGNVRGAVAKQIKPQ